MCRFMLVICLCLLWLIPVYADTGEKVIGWVEPVTLVSLNQQLKAKLDTGAKTASLDAQQITLFKKQRAQWVRFNLLSRTGIAHTVEAKIKRFVKIRKRKPKPTNNIADFVKRPVIALPVCLGGITKMIDINLTNRSHFIYPLLLGRDSLRQFNVVISPRLSMTQINTCKESS